MRAFILICVVATAIAVPQGYNYQQQQQQQPGIFPSGLANNVVGPSAAANAITQEGQSFLQEALQNTKLMQTLLSGRNTQYAPAAQNYYQRPVQQQQQRVPFGFNAQPQQQQQYAQQNNFAYSQSQQYRTAPVVTKDIYVHVAPEEPEERYQQPQVPVAPPRKHYRIVFIKAPTPSVSSSALRIKQAPSEEKTIIYVLTKKPDPLDLQTAIQEIAPKQPSKPEVYFIKYKTQEEAQHAQRTIQAQYDQLGGTTQVSDEGIAPVTSVIGALDQQQGFSGITTGSGGSGFSSSGSGVNTISTGGAVSSSGSSKYLPPIVV